ISALRDVWPAASDACASDCIPRAQSGLSRVACSYAAIALRGSPAANRAGIETVGHTEAAICESVGSPSGLGRVAPLRFGVITGVEPRPGALTHRPRRTAVSGSDHLAALFAKKSTCRAVPRRATTLYVC